MTQLALAGGRQQWQFRFAAGDSQGLAATGIQQWQAMFIILCTLIFIVTTSALLDAAIDCTFLQLD